MRRRRRIIICIPGFRIRFGIRVFIFPGISCSMVLIGGCIFITGPMRSPTMLARRLVGEEDL
jgi:hypothetical protein